MVRFYSEWREILKQACGDIRNHLHPSRRLMAGFDPNWYIVPAFEKSEFKGGITARGLREAITKDGIAVPSAVTDLDALNLLLEKDDLVGKLLKPDSPEFQSFSQPPGSTSDDYRRRSRNILETLYPLQCPRLALKNNLKINEEVTLSYGSIQSASPSFPSFIGAGIEQV